MMMRSWIRKLFAGPVARPLCKGPRRDRLAVEPLEQRCVPTFTVTNLLDDGSVGSLRWAVGQANSTGGDETIDFDHTVFAMPQTITLTGTQLELTDTTGTETISGPAAGVTVSGNNASRVFQIDLLVTASISGMTISGGHTTGNGGGLSNLGTTTLTNCNVSGNSAYASGGVNNTGTLTLTNCNVSGNSAGRGQYGTGGGLANGGGTVTLADCTVSGNSAGTGGGLENGEGTVTLTDCTVSGNFVGDPGVHYGGGSGGGLANGGGTVTLTDCTVSGNSAAGYYGASGGGLDNGGGTVTLTDCTVNGNSAGGLHGDGAGGGLLSGGNMTLTNCTISGNSAFGLYNSYGSGGGIFNTGTATLTNCTVRANGAYEGGGVNNIGTLTLTNCTVSANAAGRDGAGIRTNNVGGPTVSSTIVAANTARGNPSDITGNVNASSSYNLIGPGGSGGLIGGVNHNQVGVANPGLGTLGDHGGPTQTIDLLGGSPALNAGDPAQIGVPDQRGVVRSGGVNIGAYQASASAFVVSAPATVQSGVSFDVTVTAVDPYNQLAVGYTGTVTFSTTDSDPGVVLPADYSFTPDDGGMHLFTDTGLGETTLLTAGDQMLTVTDTADDTITGNAIITVNSPGPEPGPHGNGPRPNTLQPTPTQAQLSTRSEASVNELVAAEGWFALFHDMDYAWLTAPRPRHQAPDPTDAWLTDPFDTEGAPVRDAD
jgi:hypothetical protein